MLVRIMTMPTTRFRVTALARFAMAAGNLRPKERENDAENEACDIRHAADGEVADATGSAQ